MGLPAGRYARFVCYLLVCVIDKNTAPAVRENEYSCLPGSVRLSRIRTISSSTASELVCTVLHSSDENRISYILTSSVSVSSCCKDDIM